jgi:hypothetical protein
VLLDLLAYRHGIGFVAQPQNREENEVLEFTERFYC